MQPFPELHARRKGRPTKVLGASGCAEGTNGATKPMEEGEGALCAAKGEVRATRTATANTRAGAWKWCTTKKEECAKQELESSTTISRGPNAPQSFVATPTMHMHLG